MKLNRYSDILCSVMIPTRCRLMDLRDAVMSLQDLAAVPENIEIIVRLEDEDPEIGLTIEMLRNTVTKSKLLCITGAHGNGFADLGDHWNRMAAMSSGDWLFVFNDDCVMKTQGWDTLLYEFEPTRYCSNWLPQNRDFCVIKPKLGKGNPFPIVSRQYFKLLRRLSANTPHLDSYIERIAGPLGFEVYLPGFVIYHKRHIMKDDTHDKSSKAYSVTGPMFWRPPVQTELRKDREIIANILGIPNPTKFKQGGQEVKA